MDDGKKEEWQSRIRLAGVKSADVQMSSVL